MKERQKEIKRDLTNILEGMNSCNKFIRSLTRNCGAKSIHAYQWLDKRSTTRFDPDLAGLW